MKKIKLLLIFVFGTLLIINFSLGIRNLSNQKKPIEDGMIEEKRENNGNPKFAVRATQSEISSYGITFGTFSQITTSSGVYVNNDSNASFTNLPAIGVKGRYFVYTYSAWMGSNAPSISNVTSYVGTATTTGFPDLRISAPRSISELYWDDFGRLYFMGWNNPVAQTPIYITTTGLSYTTDDSTIIAKPQATISVSAPSGGGTVSNNITTYIGNTISVTATPNIGYSFVGWYTSSALSGTPVSTSSTYSFKVASNTALYAKFAINTYTITVNSANTAYGTVSGGGRYNYNTRVNIVATPQKGHKFISWSNGSTASTSTIIVGASNASYTASFTPIAYNIAYSGLENSTISSKPTTSNYNSIVNISNPVKIGYTFSGWTITGYDGSVAQGGTSSTSLQTLNANNNKQTYFKNLSATDGTTITFRANWVINSYQVNVNSTNQAYGTVSGTGTYQYGSTQSVVATAKTGYRFVGWYQNLSCTGNPVSTDTTYRFTIPANVVNLYAKFVQQGIHVKSTYTNTALTGNQFNNLITAINAANQQGVSEIYIDGSIGSLYANTNTFVNQVNNYIKYTSSNEIKIIGLNSSSAIYNNAANTLIDVQNGKVTFTNVQIIGSGASNTAGNRDNALLRVSGSGCLVLDQGTSVKNSYNIGSEIHYAGDWCPGTIDVANGTLIIENGVSLVNNTTTYGGDIFVHGGSVVMNGGTISNSTEMGIYVHSGSLELNGSANPGSVYLGKNVTLDVAALTNNIYVYAEGRMSAGSVFGTVDSTSSAQKIITNIAGSGDNQYYYQGALVNSNSLAWNKVTVPVQKSPLQLAIENASGQYTIVQGESISLATALGKYVKHVSGCLSIGSVEITSGQAITTGTGKRTTITGSEVGQIQITMRNVSTYYCYYYGTTKINEVSITINVLPRIGDVVESNTSIAVVNCDPDNTYVLKNSNGSVISTLTPSYDSLSGDYYVRFEYLTANTNYVIDVNKTVNGVKYTNTTNITTANETALVKAIRNASGFYFNVGESTTLANIIGRYVAHLTWCINITDVKIIASSANNVLTINGSGKNVNVTSLTPGYVDLSMKVKTNGWCAVYGTISTAQEVTIRLYVLPTINESAVTLTNTSIGLPQLGSGYYYSIDDGATWISATNSPVFTGLEANTQYNVTVGYTMPGEAKPEVCQTTYQFMTKANPTYESLVDKANKINDEIENKNISSETKENAKKIINDIINGTTEYSLETEELLNKLYEYILEIDELSPTISTGIIASEAADKFFTELSNKTVNEMMESLNENEELIEQVSKTITEIDEVADYNSALEVIEGLKTLTDLEKDALVNNSQTDYFAIIKDKYFKNAIQELEKITNIPDLMETYRAQILVQNDMTIDNFGSKVETVDLIIQKAQAISKLRIYEDETLGTTSTYFNESLLAGFETLTQAELVEYSDECYKNIAKELVKAYEITENVELNETDYQINSVTKVSNGYQYKNIVYSDIESALTVAILDDQKQVANKVITDLATETITNLNEAEKAAITTNINMIISKYQAEINNTTAFSTLELIPAIVEDLLNIETIKSNTIAQIIDEATAFKANYEIPNCNEEKNALITHYDESVAILIAQIIDAKTASSIQVIVNNSNTLIETMEERKDLIEQITSQLEKITIPEVKDLYIAVSEETIAKISGNGAAIVSLTEARTLKDEFIATSSFGLTKQDAINELTAFVETVKSNLTVAEIATLETILASQIDALVATTTPEALATTLTESYEKIELITDKSNIIQQVSAYYQKSLAELNSITTLSAVDLTYYKAELAKLFETTTSEIGTASTLAEAAESENTYYTETKKVLTEAKSITTTRNDAIDYLGTKNTEFGTELDKLINLTPDQKNNYFDQATTVIDEASDNINKIAEPLIQKQIDKVEAELNNLLNEATLTDSLAELEIVYNDALTSIDYSSELEQQITELYQTGKKADTAEGVQTAITSITTIVEKSNDLTDTFVQLNTKYVEISSLIETLTDDVIKTAAQAALDESLEKAKTGLVNNEMTAEEALNELTKIQDICNRNQSLNSSAAFETDSDLKNQLNTLIQIDTLDLLNNNETSNNQAYIDELTQVKEKIDNNNFPYDLTATVTSITTVLTDYQTMSDYDILKAYQTSLNNFVSETTTAVNGFETTDYDTTTAQTIASLKQATIDTIVATPTFEVVEKAYSDFSTEVSIYQKTTDGNLEDKITEVKQALNELDLTKPVYKDNETNISIWLDILNNAAETTEKVAVINEYQEMVKKQTVLDQEITSLKDLINRYQTNKLDDGTLEQLSIGLDSSDLTLVTNAIDDIKDLLDVDNSLAFSILNQAISLYPDTYKVAAQTIIDNAKAQAISTDYESVLNMALEAITNLTGLYQTSQSTLIAQANNELLKVKQDLSDNRTYIYSSADITTALANLDTILTNYQTAENEYAFTIADSQVYKDLLERYNTYSESITNLELSTLASIATSSLENYAGSMNYQASLVEIETTLAAATSSAALETAYQAGIETILLENEKANAIIKLNESYDNVKDIIDATSAYETALQTIEDATNALEVNTALNDFEAIISSLVIDSETITEKVNQAIEDAKEQINQLLYLSEEEKQVYIDQLSSDTTGITTVEEIQAKQTELTNIVNQAIEKNKTNSEMSSADKEQVKADYQTALESLGVELTADNYPNLSTEELTDYNNKIQTLITEFSQTSTDSKVNVIYEAYEETVKNIEKTINDATDLNTNYAEKLTEAISNGLQTITDKINQNPNIDFTSIITTEIEEATTLQEVETATINVLTEIDILIDLAEKVNSAKTELNLAADDNIEKVNELVNLSNKMKDDYCIQISEKLVEAIATLQTLTTEAEITTFVNDIKAEFNVIYNAATAQDTIVKELVFKYQDANAYVQTNYAQYDVDQQVYEQATKEIFDKALYEIAVATVSSLSAITETVDQALVDLAVAAEMINNNIDSIEGLITETTELLNQKSISDEDMNKYLDRINTQTTNSEELKKITDVTEATNKITAIKSELATIKNEINTYELNAERLAAKETLTSLIQVSQSSIETNPLIPAFVKTALETKLTDILNNLQERLANGDIQNSTDLQAAIDQIEAEVEFIVKQSETVVNLVEKDNTINIELTNVEIFNSETVLNNKLEEVLNATDEANLQTIETAYDEAIKTILDANYVEIIASLEQEDIANLDNSFEQLDSIIDAYDLVAGDKTPTYLNDLGQIIEDVTAEFMQTHQSSDITKVKILVEKYNEYTHQSSEVVENYDEYFETKLETTIEATIIEFTKALDNQNYPECLEIFEKLTILINDYEIAQTIIIFNDSTDYHDDVPTLVETAYLDLAYETILQTADKSVITATIAKIEELNSLYNETILAPTTTIYENKLSDNIIPVLENVIIETTTSMIENGDLTEEIITKLTDLIAVYQATTSTSHDKYDNYVKDELSATIEQYRADIQHAIITTTQNDIIQANDQKLIDEYLDLVVKYNVFVDDEAYEDVLNNDLRILIQIYGNQYLDQLISDVYTEEQLNKYYQITEYADLIYQSLTSDSKYAALINKGVMENLTNTYETIINGGKYQTPEIEKANEIYAKYSNEMASNTTSATIIATYYNCLAELNALPAARIKAYGELDDIRREMINSNAYQKEDLILVEEIIAKFEKSVADNEIIYYVDANCQIAKNEILEIKPFATTTKTSLIDELAKIVASHTYYPEELAVITTNYQAAINQLSENESEEFLTLTEVAELLAELNANNENIPLAFNKGQTKLNDYVRGLVETDYSALVYQQIKTYLAVALEELVEGLTYLDVQIIIDQTVQNIEVLETLTEQSFTKVKADALDYLETLKGVDRAIDQTINEKIKVISDIKPTDGKAEVTESLNIALAEILEKYQDYAIAELQKMVGSITEAEYSSEKWAEISKTLNDATTEITESLEFVEILGILVKTETIILEVSTLLEEAKTKAKAELESYLDSNNYLQSEISKMLEQIDQQNNVQDVITVKNDSITTINELIVNNEVEQLANELIKAIEDYLEALNNNDENLAELTPKIEELVADYEKFENTDVTLIPEYQEYCLEKAINDAQIELNQVFSNYYEVDYSAYHYQELTDILTKALNDLTNSLSVENVEEIKEKAKVDLEAIPTLIEEDLTSAKDNATMILDKYQDISDSITEIINNGQAEIESKTSVLDVNQAFNKTINVIYQELLEKTSQEYLETDYYQPTYQAIREIIQKATLELNENYNYNSCQQLYQEAIDKIVLIETKVEVDARKAEAVAKIEEYQIADSSAEILQIIVDGVININEAQTIMDVENNLLQTFNELEKQLLQEETDSTQTKLTEYFQTLKPDYYTSGNYQILINLLDHSSSMIEECKVKENLFAIYEQAVLDFTNVDTKQVTLKKTMEAMINDSEAILEIVEKWINIVDSIIDNNDSTYTYPNSDINYDSLDNLLTFINDSVSAEVKAQKNIEIVENTKNVIREYAEKLIATKRFSEAGISEIINVENQALSDLAELGLTTDLIETECATIYQSALDAFKAILGDNTYTSDGKVNKDAVDTELDYEPNHNFNQDGLYGNVSTNDDILDLDITLIIEKQKQSSEAIVKQTFSENKDQYDIYDEKQIDLEKSEIKALLDIYLIKNNKRYSAPVGVTYKVKILIPVEYRNTRELGIVHIADDGTLEFYELEYVGNYLVFTTSHFSDYALIGMTYLEQTREEQVEKITNTYETISEQAINYSHDQWVVIRTMYEETLSKLESKTITAPQMVEICFEAITEINKVPTILETAKKETLELLKEEFNQYSKEDYSDKNYERIETAYNDAKQAIYKAQELNEITIILNNAIYDMDAVSPTSQIVWTSIILILGILIIIALILFFCYFKVLYYDADSKEESKLLKTRHIFWLLVVNPENVRVNGFNTLQTDSKIAGIYLDAECQIPAQKFRMPFGQVMLYVKLSKIVKKTKVASNKPYVVVNFGQPTKEIKKIKTQKITEVRASSVDMLMSDEELQKINIKKEYARINPVIKGVINLDIISENFEEGQVVDLAALKGKNLISEDITHLKVLARGILNKKLIIKANAYSKDALKMIALTEGEIVLIEKAQ